MELLNVIRSQHSWLPRCNISIFFLVGSGIEDEPLRLELNLNRMALSIAECVAQVMKAKKSCERAMTDLTSPTTSIVTLRQHFGRVSTVSGLRSMLCVFEELLPVFNDRAAVQSAW